MNVNELEAKLAMAVDGIGWFMQDGDIDRLEKVYDKLSHKPKTVVEVHALPPDNEVSPYWESSNEPILLEAKDNYLRNQIAYPATLIVWENE